MCGIFGSPVFTPQVRELLPFLALSMEARGSHAWGGTNGDEIIRHLGPISNSWASERERVRSWTGGIFHTRTASQGASGVLDNAHPFSFTKADGTRVIGIHNGCLSNHTQLNSTHGRSFSVDSMHLWAHRAAGLPWTDINGYANVAWYETREGEVAPELFLAKVNSTYLHCIRTEDGGLVFASTQGALVEATNITGVPITTTYSLDEHQVYRLGLDGVAYTTGEEIRFQGSFSVDSATAARGGSGGYSNFRGSYTRQLGRCIKCCKETRDSWLICEECFKIHTDAFTPTDTSTTGSTTPLVILAAAAHAAGLGLSSADATGSPHTYSEEQRLAAMLLGPGSTDTSSTYTEDGVAGPMDRMTADEIEEVMRYAYGC